MIKLDFHLINYKAEISGDIYEYKSNGGIFFIIALIAGFFAKHFSFINWPFYAIILAAIGVCLLWDGITFGIFMIKISNSKKAAIKNAFPDTELYLMIAPVVLGSSDKRYIHINLEDKSCLPVFQNLKDAAEFVEMQIGSLPTLSQAECVPVSLQEIYDIAKEGEYPVVALVDGINYEEYSLEELKEIIDLKK